MAKDFRLVALAALSTIGIAFSGYLTLYTFTFGRSGCELYFFGFPSCFYGLLLYSLILVPSISLLLAGRNWRTAALVGTSIVGIGFSASLTAYMMSLRGCSNLTILGVPPCLLGLLMYALLLILALLVARERAPPAG